MRTSKFLWLPLKRGFATASAAALRQDTETIHDRSFGHPLGLFRTEKTSEPLQVGMEVLSSLENHCCGVHLAQLLLILFNNPPSLFWVKRISKEGIVDGEDELWQEDFEWIY